MQAADAQKYKSLEQTAQKWYDIEAKNVRDYALSQRTAVLPGSQRYVNTVVNSNNFSIGYLPKVRALVLKNSCKGNLILVDTRGRVVSRLSLSDLNTHGTAIVALPASLSAGLYLARFEGVNGVQQAALSITQ
jgi:hypothetical protein